jgi:hypothetical protein
MPSKSGRIKIAAVPTFASAVFSLGVLGLHTIDAHTMAAQSPAKCEKGQWVVAVPRTHINAPFVESNDSGPAVASIMVKYPQYSINSLLAANQELSLKPESNLPAVSGGVLCLNLPAADKVQNSALEINTATGGETHGKNLDLKFSLPKRLTNEEIVSVHYAAGFRGQSLVIMSAIARAESGGVTNSVCKNSGHGCNATWKTAISFDGGLDQINNKAWHISIQKMFNPLTSAKTAFHIVSLRHGKFHDWVTYNHGSDIKYRRQMWNAAKRIGVI